MAAVMEHAHHWIVPAPNGPSVIGTCKTCHARKKMVTHVETGMAGWGGDGGLEHARAANARGIIASREARRRNRLELEKSLYG